MTENTREMLNQIYQPISNMSHELVGALTGLHGGYQITNGFFNGHYHRNADGEYQADAYPISVISVMGLCDIEIDFDGISVTAKLSKESIRRFDWGLLGAIPFEVYGAEQYLTDYGSNQNPDEIGNRTQLSAEREFFVSLSLPVTISGDDVLKILEVLQKNGFYY